MVKKKTKKGGILPLNDLDSSHLDSKSMASDSMDNRQQSSIDYIREDMGVSVEEIPENQINEDHLRIMNARNRVNKWANDNIYDNKMINALRNGHAIRKPHRFRDVKKKKQISDMPMLNRR